MRKYLFLLFSAANFVSSYGQIADSARREIKLQGAVNFRDLGGYKTSDGRHVKWGKIYRSAALNRLSNADTEKLKDLKISIDEDFRGPYEVSTAPDRIPSDIYRISLPAGSENSGKPSELKQMMAASDKDSGMIAFYSNVTVFKARYKPVFDELLRISPDSALLFHCAAGKDRTGMAAALVLYALGVPEETIMDDYLASNYYRREVIAKDAAQMERLGMKPEEAKGLAGVKKEYLMATYSAIINKYGSIDNFLREELDLNKEKIENLKEKFLE